MKIYAIHLCLILACAPSTHGMFQGKTLKVIKNVLFKQFEKQLFNRYKKFYSTKKSDIESKEFSLEDSFKNSLPEQFNRFFKRAAPREYIKEAYLQLATLLKEQYENALINADLFKAIEDKNIDAIAQCIKCGADVNAPNEDGDTPLIFLNRYTCSCDNHVAIDIVRLLVDNKANINLQNKNGSTALIYSILNQNEVMADLLIKLHANVNIQSQFGNTALAYACRDENEILIKMLLAAGARTDIKDASGCVASDYLSRSLIGRLLDFKR